MFSITVLIGACLFSQQGVWETLLAALEVLIRAEHQQQQFNIKQLLNAHVVHHFLLTCQVLQVLFMYLPKYLLQLLLCTNPLLCTWRFHRPVNGDFFLSFVLLLCRPVFFQLLPPDLYTVILPNSNYKRTTSKFLYVSLCWNIIILWFLNINI